MKMNILVRFEVFSDARVGWEKFIRRDMIRSWMMVRSWVWFLDSWLRILSTSLQKVRAVFREVRESDAVNWEVRSCL